MDNRQDIDLKRVCEGDALAFRKLFEQFSPKVYGFALKITHSASAAEEIVQEVFLKIWMNRSELTKVDQFQAYLFTVTKNFALNILKRLAVEEKAKAHFLRQQSVSRCETEEAVILREYQDILKNAIDRLSPQQKVVYSLCHSEGLKYEEAALKLRISRLTVKTHMQQAIRSIKAHVSHIISMMSLICLSFW